MVESRGLERGYLDVQPGDCVVAFSRKDIYDIKQLIEAGTGQRWASSTDATCSDVLKVSTASAVSVTCARTTAYGIPGMGGIHVAASCAHAKMCQNSAVA